MSGRPKWSEERGCVIVAGEWSRIRDTSLDVINQKVEEVNAFPDSVEVHSNVTSGIKYTRPATPSETAEFVENLQNKIDALNDNLRQKREIMRKVKRDAVPPNPSSR